MGYTVLWWWLFGVSASAIFITYIMYPAVVYIISRLCGYCPAVNTDWKPTVSVILAARNEAGRIAERIRNIFDCDYPGDNIELVLADDCSDDDTPQVAGTMKCGSIKILTLEEHRGKPAALNAACGEATGEIFVFADARQKFARDTITHLVGNLADEKIAVVSGSLVAPPEKGVGLYWKMEKFIRFHEGRALSTIGATGAVYAIRGADFNTIAEETILDDIAIPLKALGGRRSIFDPLALAYDVAIDPKKEWRRKVRTLAGNYQLFFRPRKMGNPFQPRTIIQFLLHKILRLLVPLWMVILFVSCVFLPELLPLLYAQIAFYLLAVMGGIASGLDIKMGPLGIPFEFVLLNSAAVGAFFNSLCGHSSVRWKK